MGEISINMCAGYGDGYYPITQLMTDAQIATLCTQTSTSVVNGQPTNIRMSKCIVYFKCSDDLLDANKIYKVKFEDIRKLSDGLAFSAGEITDFKSSATICAKQEEIKVDGFTEVIV